MTDGRHTGSGLANGSRGSRPGKILRKQVGEDDSGVALEERDEPVRRETSLEEAQGASSDMSDPQGTHLEQVRFEARELVPCVHQMGVHPDRDYGAIIPDAEELHRIRPHRPRQARPLFAVVEKGAAVQPFPDYQHLPVPVVQASVGPVRGARGVIQFLTSDEGGRTRTEGGHAVRGVESTDHAGAPAKDIWQCSHRGWRQGLVEDGLLLTDDPVGMCRHGERAFRTDDGEKGVQHRVGPTFDRPESAQRAVHQQEVSGPQTGTVKGVGQLIQGEHIEAGERLGVGEAPAITAA